jgi:transposase
MDAAGGRFYEDTELHHEGVSVSEIARQLEMDRRPVREYLKQAPREYEWTAKSWQVDPYLRDGGSWAYTTR